MVTADHTSMYEIKDLEECILNYVLYKILTYGKAEYFHINKQKLKKIQTLCIKYVYSVCR
jgi:hypothetical protein